MAYPESKCICGCLDIEHAGKGKCFGLRAMANRKGDTPQIVECKCRRFRSKIEWEAGNRT